MSQDNSGPAFPVLQDRDYISFGITKRDYFAAVALQGLIAADVKFEQANDNLAEWAYQLADRMLKEREK